MFFPKTITRYIDSLAYPKKGLKVLIVNDFATERQLLLEIARHYLPESATKTLNSHELTEELNRHEPAYDLVILEAGLVLNPVDRTCIQQLRTRLPDAKLALFADRRDLLKLQTIPQFSSIDILLTKSATVEALAEKLCLTFQEPGKR